MKLRWILVPVLGGAVYFALFGGEYSLWDVRRLEKQQQEELQKLQAATLDVRRLRGRADSLERDPATLERIAREKYGMIRPGERLYRFAEERDSLPPPGSADSAAARNRPPE